MRHVWNASNWWVNPYFKTRYLLMFAHYQIIRKALLYDIAYIILDFGTKLTVLVVFSLSNIPRTLQNCGYYCYNPLFFFFIFLSFCREKLPPVASLPQTGQHSQNRNQLWSPCKREEATFSKPCMFSMEERDIWKLAWNCKRHVMLTHRLDLQSTRNSK